MQKQVCQYCINDETLTTITKTFIGGIRTAPHKYNSQLLILVNHDSRLHSPWHLDLAFIEESYKFNILLFDDFHKGFHYK